MSAESLGQPRSGVCAGPGPRASRRYELRPRVAGVAELPGVALVVRGGSVVHAVGSADARLPVASVAKQFVAAAILLLAERGSLAPGDPASRWFGPWGGDVTVHQLPTHTAGLGHWPAVGGMDRFGDLDPAERVAAIRAAAPVARPGECWSYSGLGYLLLAEIVERTAGVPYGAFAGTELFAPAGMTATTSGGAGLRAMPGTGDVVSTVADLIRYQHALPGLLRPDSRRALTMPHADLGAESYALPAVSANAYGYGNFVGTIAGRPASFHPGDNPGYQSLSAVLPGDDTTLAVLLHDDAIRLSAVLADLTAYL
jgi:CubicO group peptidase (beta-lactamase class C family)